MIRKKTNDISDYVLYVFSIEQEARTSMLKLFVRTPGPGDWGEINRNEWLDKNKYHEYSFIIIEGNIDDPTHQIKLSDGRTLYLDFERFF